MKIRQVVQVQILGAPRTYTYSWEFDPLAGEQSLGLGDKVEIPPNQVQEEGAAATVVDLGSNYNGPMKSIVRVIKRAHEMRPTIDGFEVHETGPPDAPDGGLTLRRPAGGDDLWGGFGEGDYA